MFLYKNKVVCAGREYKKTKKDKGCDARRIMYLLNFYKHMLLLFSVRLPFSLL